MATIEQVSAELTAFSQQTLDTLTLHSVRINAAQADADAAQLAANSALTQILQTGVTATNYTDTRFENLRLALEGLITSFTGNVNTSIANEVAAQVALFEPQLNASLNTAVANAQAIADNLDIDLSNFSGVTNQILNTDLPGISAEIASLGTSQTSTAAQLAAALEGLGHATIAGGLDSVIQVAVGLVQPFGSVVLRGPVALWTTTSDAILLGSKLPPTAGQFFTDDPVFGEVYEFPAGQTSIGPVSPLPYDASRMYRFLIRFRVVSDGTTGGCSVAFGSTLWAPGTTYETAPVTYTVADGSIQLSAYASGNTELLNRLSGKTPFDLRSAEVSSQIFPFIRQNADGVTNGTIRLNSFEIVDVTEAFEARGAVADGFDVTPPEVPTGLAAVSDVPDGVTGRMVLTWDLPTADDVAFYDIGLSEGAGNEVAFPVTLNRWEVAVTPGETYTIRIRARDRFSNASAYTAAIVHVAAGDSIAPAQVTGLTASPGFNSVWLNWTENAEPDLAHYEIFEQETTTPAPLSGTAASFSSGASNLLRSGLGSEQTRSYWVRAVDVSGNAGDWSTLVTTTTAPAVDDIPDNAILASKLTAGEVITGTAQIRDAIITNAKITNLSAAKLIAGTALTSSLTVNGTALTTIQSQANNPAARINAAETRIDPGRILISGTTTLASWRTGGDETKINGGEISANTITANKLSIGSRGISTTGLVFEYNLPATDEVSWTAGEIEYINDAGAPQSVVIAAGSALWELNTLFIYWAKDAGVLSTTTSAATAFAGNNVILATYKGEGDLNANYGRTIIDGATIKTGSITADQITASSLSAISGVIGTLSSAATGERVVIEDSRISVYDAGNNLRVRIGDLT